MFLLLPLLEECLPGASQIRCSRRLVNGACSTSVSPCMLQTAALEKVGHEPEAPSSRSSNRRVRRDVSTHTASSPSMVQNPRQRLLLIEQRPSNIQVLPKLRPRRRTRTQSKPAKSGSSKLGWRCVTPSSFLGNVQYNDRSQFWFRSIHC
jgi:hypothetical protein